MLLPGERADGEGAHLHEEATISHEREGDGGHEIKRTGEVLDVWGAEECAKKSSVESLFAGAHGMSCPANSRNAEKRP